MAWKNLGVEMQSERVYWRSKWVTVLHSPAMFLWLGEGIRIQAFDLIVRLQQDAAGVEPAYQLHLLTA